MKSFGIIVNLGGRSKRIKKSVAGQITYAKGPVYGLTEYYGPKNGGMTGCKVWIYSRQSKRELADTFFHEMTHVFLQMIGGVRKQGRDEELAARLIGYLSKTMLADYSAAYARSPSKQRIIG